MVVYNHAFAVSYRGLFMQHNQHHHRHSYTFSPLPLKPHQFLAQDCATDQRHRQHHRCEVKCSGVGSLMKYTHERDTLLP